MTERQVVAAYQQARDQARGMSSFRLRWYLRWSARHTNDRSTRALRAAVRDELEARGEELP